MKKLGPVLCLILICFVGSACSIFSKAREENLNQVQLGQTKAELIALIGEPSDKSEPGTTERWYYEVTSRDEKRSDPYTAVFENDKLKNWYFDAARVEKRSSQPAKGRRSKASAPIGG
jgi:outer membrane protein assembly factor BamE (lipoprotein component of BamABCDE complex)